MTAAWQPDAFAGAVLGYFAQCGRKDLPWQLEPTPYRVWVSEVMLQQTQVSVVIPYFERFVARFPDLRALAGAEQDAVLRHWAGLGYYARARHLHRAARLVVDNQQGELPTELGALMALPGIGRSTAAAVLSLAGGQAHAILDGNVKRVLARCFAIDGWPGQSGVRRRLWALADELMAGAVQAGTVGADLAGWSLAAAYNQAMMDLGATLCTRANPSCHECPLRAHCLALASDSVPAYPQPKPRAPLPQRAACWLLIMDANDRVLLERRLGFGLPGGLRSGLRGGLWEGLWTLPEIALDEDSADWCERRLGRAARRVENLAPRRHCFSHFTLDIHPRRVVLEGEPRRVEDEDQRVWLPLEQALAMAIPAPVKALLLESRARLP